MIRPTAFARAFLLAGLVVLSGMRPVDARSRSPAPGSPAASPRAWRDRAARAAHEEGSKLAERGMLNYAVDQFQLALSREPRPETMKALAEAFDALDQPVLAAAQLERYVAEVPGDPEAWNRLGCIRLKQKRPADALRAFRALVRLDPETGRSGLQSAYLAAGEQQLERRDYRKAEQTFTAAMETGGTEPRALDGLKKALREQASELLARGAHREALDKLLKLYEWGQLENMRAPLEKAFRGAGRPQDLAARVKGILADPRLR